MSATSNSFTNSFITENVTTPESNNAGDSKNTGDSNTNNTFGNNPKKMLFDAIESQDLKRVLQIIETADSLQDLRNQILYQDISKGGNKGITTLDLAIKKAIQSNALRNKIKDFYNPIMTALQIVDTLCDASLQTMVSIPPVSSISLLFLNRLCTEERFPIHESLYAQLLCSKDKKISFEQLETSNSVQHNSDEDMVMGLVEPLYVTMERKLNQELNGETNTSNSTSNGTSNSSNYAGMKRKGKTQDNMLLMSQNGNDLNHVAGLNLNTVSEPKMKKRRTGK